jgi:hypothetical protein
MQDASLGGQDAHPTRENARKHSGDRRSVTFQFACRFRIDLWAAKTKFRARECAMVDKLRRRRPGVSGHTFLAVASRDEYLTIGQQVRRVARAGSNETPGKGPGSAYWIEEF